MILSRLGVVALDFIQEKLSDDGCKHSMAVADIISRVTISEDVIVAGILHDVLEDTDVTKAELVKLFGKKIADLVDEVTHHGQADEHGYYFPNLHSQEAIMIKLADRLHNLSRMGEWSEERRQAYLKHSKFWREQ
jgi:(p)ppGpp synthase/HD superfamily hydrolase